MQYSERIDQMSGKIPEITARSIVLGILLSIILAAANAYLGLFAGMTVSASIPAAVVSMGVLRLLRRGNILENNIVQTAASAGESLAAGVIFTLPALVILDFWKDFNYLWVTLIAGFGGILGVLFTIPLRRALIIEQNLKFPEGIATAEVLESGQGDTSGIKHIVKASIAAGAFKLGSSGLRLWPGVFETARPIGSTVAYFGTNLSPALLSVGYIVGLNIAVLIFLGGVCNWIIAIPICAAMQTRPVVDGQILPAIDWAHTIWASQTRYIGVGAMLVGGIWAVLKMRTSVWSGIKSGLKAYRKIPSQNHQIPRTEKDMPMKWVLILMIASVVPLFLVYQFFVRQVSVALPMAVIMLLTGFVFSAVAGYMAGLVGSSNNPISGVTIATVLVSSLLLLILMGSNATNGPAAAIIIGSVVCCAAAIAGDNMQDLKAGQIVGATPWKQQVMQIVGTVSAALVMAPILIVLFNAYGFKGHASAKVDALAAPQASLMAAVAKGVFASTLQWNYIYIGMATAVLVIAFDKFLEHKKSSFRMPVLAFAIGFYLPFELSVPIFAGGCIAQLLRIMHTKKSIPKNVTDESSRKGLLFASGLITGEALMGILLAIPIVASGNADILKIADDPLGSIPGIILLIAIATWLFNTANAKTEKTLIP
jgi:putative OPT family oligopeptide transporter